MTNVDDVRRKIIEQAHGSRYSIHLDATKMYRNLQLIYWWNGLKKDFMEFVAKFPNCQQEKEEHLRVGGLTKDIDILHGYWKMSIRISLCVCLIHEGKII